VEYFSNMSVVSPHKKTSRKRLLEKVKKLMVNRRKGMGYLRTHMGRMLHERPIFEEDFQSGSSSSPRLVKDNCVHWLLCG
jgi:hypothetical protein